jgi:solute carrier family 7 (cationic amino acid transporter), member 4
MHSLQPRVTVYDEQRRNLLLLDESEDDALEQAAAGTLKPKFRFLSFLEFLYPGFAVDVCLWIFAIFVGGFFAVVVYAASALAEGAAWAVILVVLLALGFSSAFLVIFAHRKRRLNLPFKMPFVPFIPALSVALNIMLLANLSGTTWIRFSVWFSAGKFHIYLFN